MKRNTAQLKEQLIQTGIDEIGKHGIEQLSLRTVAKVCGVTHGSPYRHFESKEGPQGGFDPAFALSQSGNQ